MMDDCVQDALSWLWVLKLGVDAPWAVLIKKFPHISEILDKGKYLKKLLESSGVWPIMNWVWFNHFNILCLDHPFLRRNRLGLFCFLDVRFVWHFFRCNFEPFKWLFKVAPDPFWLHLHDHLHFYFLSWSLSWSLFLFAVLDTCKPASIQIWFEWRFHRCRVIKPKWLLGWWLWLWIRQLLILFVILDVAQMNKLESY